MKPLAELIRDRANLRSGPFPQTNNFQVVNTKHLPLANILAVEARFQPLTDKSRDYYSTVIVWHGIDYTEGRDGNHTWRIEIVPGLFRYMLKPSVTQTQCRITCTCADYYFAWWYWNKTKADALAWVDFPAYVRSDGKPPGYKPFPGETYIAKDGTVRLVHQPHPNSEVKTPGVCKHINALARYLLQKKFIGE